MITKFLEKLIASGMTQKEIAEKTGTKQQMISRFLKGQPPTVETLIKIAKAFGVSTDTVLGLDEPKEPDTQSKTKQRKQKTNSYRQI